MTSYFDINTILSEEEVTVNWNLIYNLIYEHLSWCLQRVTAEFVIEAKGLGYLDPARDASVEPDVSEAASLKIHVESVGPPG